MSDRAAAEPVPELGDRLAGARAQVAVTWARTLELRQQTERLLAETQAVQKLITDARQQRRSCQEAPERLRRSEYARLQARLETMPVIEQAKGIIMAQSHCGNGQAFDLLRRASQRSNVPVRDLAAQIVTKTASIPAPPQEAAAGTTGQRRA
jgi:hypothetical protein